jgi:hypothetical protein
MRLGGSRTPLQCVRCNGLSYVTLTGRHARWSLAILGLGFVASYPSAASSNLFARMPLFVLAAIRLEIWATAILVAFAIFAFASPLKKLETPVPPRWNLWMLPFRTLFVVSIGAYGYFLLRQLQHVS